MTAPVCFVDTETISLAPDADVIWEVGLIVDDVEHQLIPLSEGRRGYALVDASDAPAMAEHRWRIDERKHTSYVVTGQRRAGTHLYAHRFLMEAHGYAISNMRVDHINGNGLDLRLSNMRLASAAQNGRNRQRGLDGSSSRFIGVSWRSRDAKWEAYIKVDRSQIHLGLFSDERDAALARDRAAIEYHGSFATLNFARWHSL